MNKKKNEESILYEHLGEMTPTDELLLRRSENPLCRDTLEEIVDLLAEFALKESRKKPGDRMNSLAAIAACIMIIATQVKDEP